MASEISEIFTREDKTSFGLPIKFRFRFTFEVGVLDWFARLWEVEKNEYRGYITKCGTEGNLHGILVRREVFPDGSSIINDKIGTTVKGAVDDLVLVIKTLEENGFNHDRFYIHRDGAVFGLMMPFVKRHEDISEYLILHSKTIPQIAFLFIAQL
ncbi:hypothetical protein POM88_023758 [Heracleum sosnowskyi]|uniref:Uncharacterized protein n=1 Tax=Heracleum sosnowskyi TaxID=360622 RepID=A0AAD8IK34_9APIA|nr:hypothetical protein POM88_023758 [Heracleum sosnowskyi]